MSNRHGEFDLSGVNVFVGGPIQHAISDGGFHQPLRDVIAEIIQAVRAVNGTAFSAHVVEKFGDDTALFSATQVSVRDFDWMQRCDVFVAVLPVDGAGDLMRTDGTHIELGWATALRKPVILVTPLPFAANASHLLRGLPAVGNVTVLNLGEIRSDLGHLLRQLAEHGSEVVTSP